MMKKRPYLSIFFILISLIGCQKEKTPLQSPELSDFKLSAVTEGQSSFKLIDPKSKSSGAFYFRTNDPSLVTIQDNIVTIKKSGTCIITAIQQQTENFRRDSITATLVIAPRLLPIIGTLVIPDKKVTDPPFLLTRPKSINDGEMIFQSDNTAVAVVTGNLVTIKGAGKAIITASQAQSGIYAAQSVFANLVVTDAVVAEALTDVDGNVYMAVKIGTQTWMMENLRTTHYRDGTIIPNVTGNAEWGIQSNGAYCSYDNNLDKGKLYGHLYNWHAVNNTRQLAPRGWHIPTSAEWAILYNYIGGDRYSGGKIQESGTSHWSSDTGASNITKFTGLPGGKRSGDGKYESLSLDANWWTATANSGGTAWYYNLYVKGYIEAGEGLKNMGYSIRCIKD
ncbi:Fibrobacter succinogenes major domain [compost metagenome]